MTKTSIGILTGSLRRESYSKKIGLYVTELLLEDFTGIIPSWAFPTSKVFFPIDRTPDLGLVPK
jgi:NAD(P)H-dependent FMN reductase